MEVSITGIPGLIIIGMLTIIPLKIAASWFDAQRTSLPFCLLATIAGPTTAYLGFSLVGGGFVGFLAALVAMAASLGVILGTGIGSALKLGIVALILSSAAFKFVFFVMTAVI